MGKSSGKAKQAGRKGPGSRPLSAQQLFEQAQIALQYDDFDAARTALKKAAKMEPMNIVYVDALGALLAEIGPENEAIQVLRHAITLSPEDGYEKYLYLAQLIEGQEAITLTRKGVALVAQQADAAKAPGSQVPEEEQKILCQAYSGALCSLAELILNEADDLATVSAEVQGLLGQAQQADTTSPEPGQVLASLLYEQGKSEEALAALRQSMALWYKPTKDDDENEEDMEDGDGKGSDDAMDEDSDDDEEEEDDGPSYEFRVECVKLLLELEDTTETAIDILETLIEENDGDPVTWHLLGLAYYSGHNYTEAQEIVDKGKVLLAKYGIPADDELATLFEELQTAITEALALQGGSGADAAGDAAGAK